MARRLVKFQLSRHRCGSSPASLACWVMSSDIASTTSARTLGAQGTDFLAGAFRVTPQEPGGAGGLDILPGELPIEHLDCINILLILLFNISVYITCCTCRYESIIPV
jgi:hypothetical protein